LNDAHKLLKDAVAADNVHYRAFALESITRYYYMNNPDSFYHYYRTLEALVLQQKDYQNFFRYRSWYIYQLIHDQKMKQALAEINKDIRKAKAMKRQDLLDGSLQDLAHYYKVLKMNKESFKLCEDILASMEKRHAKPEEQINMLREILTNCPNDEKLLLYLSKFKGFINVMKRDHIDSYSSLLTLRFLEYTYYKYLAAKYLMPHKKYKEAKETLLNMVKVDSDRFSHDLNAQEMWVEYYMAVGDDKSALERTGRMLELAQQKKEAIAVEVILDKRATLLYKVGLNKEAYETSRLFIQVHDSLNSESYNKDLVTLRTQLDVDKLEMQNKQAELDAAHAKAYVNYLMWGGVTLVLIILILVNIVRYSRKETKRVNEARSQEEENARRKLAFFANMNHEIRTPLNAIDGFSQLIMEENDPEMRRQQYAVIHNSNEMLQRLVAEVLDVSKLEAHSMTFFNKPLDVPSLMKELESFFKMRVPEGVELILRECAPLTLVTDRNRLTQVITNLFNNAVKHTKQGSITFGYELSGENVKFYMQDTGEGIPADKVNDIFNQYVQLGSNTSGVGLGLTICKGIVEQMDGKIGVDSVLEKGSTFWFVIPMKK
jgi:signal transduction histidine kinase